MTNLRKVEAILAYFANYPDMKYLGKVKLMKLFYFLDFDHLRQYGSPVTYDKYVNLEHGPIPSNIKNLVDSAADDPDTAYLSDVIKCEFPLNTDKMCKIVPRRSFTPEDEDLFSDSELKTMQAVARKYSAARADKIERDSHQEAPWRETEKLDEIPYYLAAHDKNSRFSEEDLRLVQS
jgi:uncharacterized phage-associated protein